MKFSSDLESAEVAVTRDGDRQTNVWVHRSNRVNCAYLKVWNGQTKLNLNRNSDIANSNYGTLRVRRKFFAQQNSQPLSWLFLSQ